MKIFTSHLRDGEAPALVREGFSWAGLIFGWLYLLIRGAFIPAALNLAVLVLVLWLDRVIGSGAPVLGLVLLQGLCTQDLLRWHWSLRGYRPGPVVMGADADQALARLFSDGAMIQDGATTQADYPLGAPA